MSFYIYIYNAYRYQTAVSDYREKDPLIEGKRAWLEKQLDTIDDKVRAINLNYAEVLEKINEQAQNATQELQVSLKGFVEGAITL